MGLNRTYDYNFERVWKVYPRHEGKPEAEREFLKLGLTSEDTDELIAHIDKRKREDVQWVPNERGNTFVPHLCRFLKHRRFEDDYKRIRSAAIRHAMPVEEDTRPEWQKRGFPSPDSYRAHCDRQRDAALAALREARLLH